MGMKKTMDQDGKMNVTLRLDAPTRERLAALAEHMGARAGGLPLSESYAMRACMQRGIDEFEAELGIGNKAKKGKG